MPYPLPCTALHERVKNRIKKEWKAQEGLISDHVLIFDADFSEIKMKFAIFKGQVQFRMNKMSGKNGFFLKRLFEMPTDSIFRMMK